MKSIFKRLVFLLMLVITGCGGDSGDGDLIGSLTLDAKTVDDTGGIYHAESTGVYTHPEKDATGVELSFSLVAYTASGAIVSQENIKKKQPAGGLTITWSGIQQTTETIIVDVSVTTGDLKQFKRLSIPKISPLQATPAFVNMSTGLTQNVTISGSITPYSVISSPTGVTTAISGSGLIISENTFNHSDGTIIIGSDNGDRFDILLRY